MMRRAVYSWSTSRCSRPPRGCLAVVFPESPDTSTRALLPPWTPVLPAASAQPPACFTQTEDQRVGEEQQQYSPAAVCVTSGGGVHQGFTAGAFDIRQQNLPVSQHQAAKVQSRSQKGSLPVSQCNIRLSLKLKKRPLYSIRESHRILSHICPLPMCGLCLKYSEFEFGSSLLSEHCWQGKSIVGRLVPIQIFKPAILSSFVYFCQTL